MPPKTADGQARIRAMASPIATASGIERNANTTVTPAARKKSGNSARICASTPASGAVSSGGQWLAAAAANVSVAQPLLTTSRTRDSLAGDTS